MIEQLLISDKRQNMETQVNKAGSFASLTTIWKTTLKYPLSPAVETIRSPRFLRLLYIKIHQRRHPPSQDFMHARLQQGQPNHLPPLQSRPSKFPRQAKPSATPRHHSSSRRNTTFTPRLQPAGPRHPPSRPNPDAPTRLPGGNSPARPAPAFRVLIYPTKKSQ